MESTPEFYTGAPVDPVDLRYRGAFLKELWRALRTRHVVLTAPRRTGKTSVMDHLHDNPENGVSVDSSSRCVKAILAGAKTGVSTATRFSCKHARHASASAHWR